MTYNQRETIIASESLRKVRRTQSLGQNILITLLDKQGKEIHDQSESLERIEELFSELYNNQADPKKLLEVPPSEVNIRFTI